MQDLLTLEQALSLTAEQNARLHTRHLNPRLATILELIGASTPVTRGAGVSYWDASGREYLDFMSGFGALSLGYSHPRLEAALDRVREIPDIPEGLSHLAAALAHNLTTLAPPGLTRVFFASSGAEAVDTAIKLSRTHFSGLVLLTLRQQHGVMTSYTLHNSNVIRLQPPLIIDRGHVDRFVDSLDATLRSLANFPKAVVRSWRIIRRAALAGYAPSSSA